jgi:hypothetical protein
MGLFSTTTIISSTSTTNVVVDNSAVAAATNRVADATNKVARATDKVASAVGDDRITLSHARYAELYNKGEKLDCAKKYVQRLVVAALRTALNSDEYKYISNPNYYYSMGVDGRIIFLQSLAYDDVFFIMDGDSKTADLYRKNEGNSYSPDNFGRLQNYEPIQIEEPFLMNDEDGQVQVSGVEYKKAIVAEREYDEVYSNIRETLPQLVFNMINPSQYAAHVLVRNIQNRSDFTHEFDGLIFQYSPNGINLKKK